MTTEPTYIREEFAARHNIAPGRTPEVILGDLRTIDPRRLSLDQITVVAAPTICELIGVTKLTFNGWKQKGYGPGDPPAPRWFTGRGKMGSAILWSFETDIVPWLWAHTSVASPRASTGRSYLLRMIEEIQAGLYYPVYDETVPHKALTGYSRVPVGRELARV